MAPIRSRPSVSDEHHANASTPPSPRGPADRISFPTPDLTECKKRKSDRVKDPVVSAGKHFARTVDAITLPHTLIMRGLFREGEMGHIPDCDLEESERRSYESFKKILQLLPSFSDRIYDQSDGGDKAREELATRLQKGGSTSRSDDTRGLKVNIINWIRDGNEPLNPPLTPTTKTHRGFNHPRTGFLLCPADQDWDDPSVQARLRDGTMDAFRQMPKFVYENYRYHVNDPWHGLLKSALLVRAFKFVFTAPSSAEETGPSARATRPGNASLHNMTAVTPGSLAYIATQVRFALTSQPTFCRNDAVTDTEGFYFSILGLLENTDEKGEVEKLLHWWNKNIFPEHTDRQSHAEQNAVLANIKARRAHLKELTNTQSTSEQAYDGGN